VDWGANFHSPVRFATLPDLTPQRELAHFLGLAVLQAHHDGDDPAALEFVDDLCFLARAMDQQPFTTAHYVAIRFNELAAERLVGVAPGLRVSGDSRSGASPEQVRAMIDQMLDPGPPREGLLRALRGERASQLDTVRELVHGSLTLRSLQWVPHQKLDRSDYAMRHIMKPSHQIDARLMLRHAGRALDAARAPDWPSAMAMLGTRDEELGDSVIRHPLAHFLTPHYRGELQRHHTVLTNRRMAAVALAVRWFAVEHAGRLPGSLDELIPRYLPAVPLDPMAKGRPLGYLPGPARPLVYSVGYNSTDDGGSDAPSRESWGDEASQWQRRDAVVHLVQRPRQTVDVRLGDPSVEEAEPLPCDIPVPPWARTNRD
jgi:hypothetical protein